MSFELKWKLLRSITYYIQSTVPNPPLRNLPPPEPASLRNLPPSQTCRSFTGPKILETFFKKNSIFSKTCPLPGPVYHMYGSGLWAKLKSELGCAPVILWKLANLYHFLSTDKRVSPFLDVITVTQQEHKAGSTINRGTCYTHSACACNWLFDYLQ